MKSTESTMGHTFSREKAVEVTFLLLRLVTGFLFMQVGAAKLFGWFGRPPVTLMSQMGLAGILEFFGGILILLGLGTRPVAFILSGQMAVAYFQAHQPKGTWPIQNHGEQAVLFCFIYLFMAAYGGGRWSLDSLTKRKLKRA